MSEATLMHKTERLSNHFFSNSFIHYQAKQIKKGVISVQIVLEVHRRNTVEAIFKVEQFHLHTSLGHRNAVFIL